MAAQWRCEWVAAPPRVCVCAFVWPQCWSGFAPHPRLETLLGRLWHFTILLHLRPKYQTKVSKQMCWFPLWISAPTHYNIWQRYTSKIWQWTVPKKEKLPFSEKCITANFAIFFSIQGTVKRSLFFSNQTISLYCYLLASCYLCTFQMPSIIDNVLWTAALMWKLQKEIWLQVLEPFTVVKCKKPNSVITEGLQNFSCIFFCKKKDWLLDTNISSKSIFIP